jgi:hypothetical protein
MARREPTGRRRAAFREPQPRVLIVCGAKKTESEYFKGLRSLLGTRAVDIKILERPRSPEQVVEYTRDHCSYEDFDESWCVVDVDRFEREGEKVSAAASLALDSEIRLAASNPCFEYWLLLHHTDHASAFDSCSKVVTAIRRFVQSYDKSALRFIDFAHGVPDAVGRAQQRDPTGANFSRNPSSAVWLLVSRLLEAKQ